jgi:hypothetical protein
VPHYRSEPRYAAWSAFKLPEWVKSPGLELAGDDVSPRSPDAGVVERDGGPSATAKLGDKRATKIDTFLVKLRTDDGATHDYAPSSEEELKKLAPSTQHHVRVKAGRVSIDAAN